MVASVQWTSQPVLKYAPGLLAKTEPHDIIPAQQFLSELDRSQPV